MTTTTTHRQSTCWLHREGIVNGIRWHWVETGVRNQPLVLLLHGFPEFWYSWRHQIPFLAQQGYHVIAPDLRGYNLSEKPTRGYDMDTLTKDILELIQLLSRQEQVNIVGHDWGAMIAWAFAAKFAEKVNKLIVLNGMHLPQIYAFTWKQRFYWNYRYNIFLWNIPFLPELCLRINHSWFIGRILRKSVVAVTMEEKTIQLYRDAASQPRAIRSMLAYYRNVGKSTAQAHQYGKIQSPVLLLWGTLDPLLDTEHSEIGRQAYLDAPVQTVWFHCGHSPQYELPDQVNEQILRFLREIISEEKKEML